MKYTPTVACVIIAGIGLDAGLPTANAQPTPVRPPVALTIYNQNFGVVREVVPLNLKQGVNELHFDDISAHLEPDSIILRDPAGKRQLQILEQNYRNDPVTQGRMLSLFEGQTIEFVTVKDGREEIVRGKVVRSSYVAPQPAAQQRSIDASFGQPIIEVAGKLQFTLPGIPLFPQLPNDTILKPSLNALLQSDTAGPLAAELAYVTGGMSWKADYNLISPERGDEMELVGWITMDNQCGKDFEKARVKLMAGDVSKLQPVPLLSTIPLLGYLGDRNEKAPRVTEKSFDEYHLYTLGPTVTLHDRETKQVEFVRATGIKSERVYVYEGAAIESRYRNYDSDSIRSRQDYGTTSNPKVWVMREFKNSTANRLGIPLPKGRLRFYRRDSGEAGTPNAAGSLEFTGENLIDHTAKDETVRVYTGNAFDLAGQRRQTSYKHDYDKRTVDESFEIKLRNHKKEAASVRVVERMYRAANWEITQSSHPAMKTDSRTVEFRTTLAPNEEKAVTYSVHYSW